jgi:hypothetical protein
VALGAIDDNVRAADLVVPNQILLDRIPPLAHVARAQDVLSPPIGQLDPASLGARPQAGETKERLCRVVHSRQFELWSTGILL